MAFLMIGMIALISCSDEPKTSRLEIWLTDDPGDYDEVNIDIQGVEVHSSSGEQSSGWQSIPVQQGIYNLLELTNGLDTLLGVVELPAGKISQVRLILGQDNTLRIGDDVYDLVTPSAQQSGLKLNVHKDLLPGVTYSLLLDFDAAKSIVALPTMKFNLKPVIRVITEATSGAIDGVVLDPEAKPAVYAIAGADTVTTTFADSVSGAFLLRGLPAGSYLVSFSPVGGYAIDDIPNVSVTIGSVTHLGDIEVLE
jgi:hypothetical protein